MADRFELFRFSLLKRKQLDLEGEEFREYSREEWLRKVFSEEQPFIHHGSEFHYVPKEDKGIEKVVIGKVGRHILREENRPPEEGLDEFMHETWLAALVVIDPVHHDDGQKLAFQIMTEVGNPLHLVRSMLGSINKRYIYGPYAIEAGAIIETQSFWNFVKENEGNITSVSFDLIAPNMFGNSDDWDEDMREFRDQEHARKIRLTMNNADGKINPDTPRIREAVSYAERTSGAVRARTRGKKNYNSKDTGKRSYIDDVAETGIEIIKVASKLANRILGRE